MVNSVRGVDSDMKEIFHFMLEFPATYPLNPPSVTLCTPLPHPNVFPAKYVITYLFILG
jgi:ubiquitin-protein ligase